MRTKELIESAGLSYAWYVHQAQAILRELEQGKEYEISPSYLREKCKNVLSILEDATHEAERLQRIKKLEASL